jgi:cellulose synthase/poly-beta-1,6-N-acetylglucosamine synthase-like glycosyltransferase
VLLALGTLALVGQLLLALAAWFNQRNAPDAAAEPPLPPDEAPSLLVVVPARDEEANIGACIAALRASDHPRWRLRVVDDNSRDGTAAAARAAADGDPRVEIVGAGAMPDGWLGKNHALTVGARGAAEPWILFLDADVRVAPSCLSHALACAVRRGADLFTMMPKLEMRSFWEVAVQPLVAQLIDAWLPAREINDPRHRRAGAIGPFLLFRREAYQASAGTRRSSARWSKTCGSPKR